MCVGPPVVNAICHPDWNNQIIQVIRIIWFSLDIISYSFYAINLVVEFLLDSCGLTICDIAEPYFIWNNLNLLGVLIEYDFLFNQWLFNMLYWLLLFCSLLASQIDPTDFWILWVIDQSANQSATTYRHTYIPTYIQNTHFYEGDSFSSIKPRLI